MTTNININMFPRLDNGANNSTQDVAQIDSKTIAPDFVLPDTLRPELDAFTTMYPLFTDIAPGSDQPRSAGRARSYIGPMSPGRVPPSWFSPQLTPPVNSPKTVQLVLQLEEEKRRVAELQARLQAGLAGAAHTSYALAPIPMPQTAGPAISYGLPQFMPAFATAGAPPPPPPPPPSPATTAGFTDNTPGAAEGVLEQKVRQVDLVKTVDATLVGLNLPWNLIISEIPRVCAEAGLADNAIIGDADFPLLAKAVGKSSKTIAHRVRHRDEIDATKVYRPMPCRLKPKQQRSAHKLKNYQ